MRIVGLITHDDHGGAQSAMLRLCDGLRERGHEVVTVFFYGVDRGITGDRRDDLQVLMPEGCRTAFDYARLPYRLWRCLRGIRPDAVVSFLPLANCMGQLVASLAGVRGRIASQRNPLWTYSGVMRALDGVVGTVGVYRANVCVSEAVRRSCAARPASYRKRLVVVHNGLTFAPCELDPLAARQRLNLPPDAPLIGALGRLSAQKNLDVLLSALVDLPGAILVLAGAGELAISLRERAERLGIGARVLQLGQLPADDIAVFLRALDVFVQPSHFEGQSNALLEAMASGLPIVASDIPAQRETLLNENEGETGLVLPADDVTAWRCTLRNLLCDSTARSKLAQGARSRAQLFSLSAMIDRFERIISRTIRS